MQLDERVSDMTEQYWLRRYTEFYESFPSGAEKSHLAKVSEDHLAKDPATFVHFLLVNHVLNESDPIGHCYPAIWNEYSDYAWEIVEQHQRSDPASFSLFLENRLSEIWNSLSRLNEEEQLRTISEVKNKIVTCLRTGPSEG